MIKRHRQAQYILTAVLLMLFVTPFHAYADHEDDGEYFYELRKLEHERERDEYKAIEEYEREYQKALYELNKHPDNEAHRKFEAEAYELKAKLDKELHEIHGKFHKEVRELQEDD